MAFSWFVYTPLGAKDALAVEDRLRGALDALFVARPTLLRKGEEWGDVTVEEAVPSVDDVVELSEAYGREVSDEVLDRLETCRTALSVERAGARELDPLQVSVLRWLLAELGPCLVDWGDLQIVLSEDILREIDEYKDVGPLAGGAPDVPDPAEEPDDLGEPEHTDLSGLERSAETERAIEALSEDPFLKKRLLRTLEQLPAFVKKYVERLGERGPISDSRSARELGVSRDVLEPALEKLHETAKELAEDLDE